MIQSYERVMITFDANGDLNKIYY